jgi:hypothetical protein
VNDLAKSLGWSTDDTQQVIDSLVKKGVLLNINDKLYLNKTKITADDVPKPERQRPSITVPHVTPTLVIRVAMAVVAAGAIYMSMYYSFQWLLEFLEPWRSGLLAFVMVVYLALSIQVAGRLYHDTGAVKKVYATVIVLTAVIVFAFSVISTIAGQYNATVDVQAESVNVQSTTIEEQIAGIQDRMDSKRREIDVLQNLLEEFDTLEKRTENWPYYITTRDDLERLNSEYETLREELNAARERRAELAQTEGAQAVQAGSFYQFLASLTGLSVWVVRFILSIAPALFIDVVGPVALAVALFLREEDHGQK